MMTKKTGQQIRQRYFYILYFVFFSAAIASYVVCLQSAFVSVAAEYYVAALAVLMTCQSQCGFSTARVLVSSYRMS